jgi:N6-L-threonylcarbamoyladenine synthase
VASLIVSGGVACNSLLRERFRNLPPQDTLPVFFPSPALSTDNAAMIAAAAYPMLASGARDGLDMAADAALILGASAQDKG